jgi:hypothetical protein
MKRIAIVGGGPGGLFTARLLSEKLNDRIEITLFEATPWLGGKVATECFKKSRIAFEAGTAELYDYSMHGPDPWRAPSRGQSTGTACGPACKAARSRSSASGCSRAVIADPNMFSGVQHHIMGDDPASRWRPLKMGPQVIKIEWLRAQGTGTANRNKLAEPRTTSVSRCSRSRE